MKSAGQNRKARTAAAAVPKESEPVEKKVQNDTPPDTPAETQELEKKHEEDVKKVDVVDIPPVDAEHIKPEEEKVAIPPAKLIEESVDIPEEHVEKENVDIVTDKEAESAPVEVKAPVAKIETKVVKKEKLATKRSRTTRVVEDEDEEEQQERKKEEATTSVPSKPKALRPKAKKSKTTKTQCAEPKVSDADSDSNEAVISMLDLCKAAFSCKEKRSRKKKESMEAEEETETPEAPKPVLPEPIHMNHQGPKIRMVNGQVVIDESSLVVTHNASVNFTGGQFAEIVEDSENRMINSSSFSNKSKGARWTAAETELFYESLGQWGTDFEMMSKLFKNKTRKHLKNKYNREERLNPNRVAKALKAKKKVSDETLKAIIGTEAFEDATTAGVEKKEALEAELAALDEVTPSERPKVQYSDSDNDAED
ncbi:hypothetical protein MP638_004470 [Amoeboaphelidium occidentale]|nr:hypothetical protein MP638_004470 [Amoeboaphelidium occidentale]